VSYGVWELAPEARAIIDEEKGFSFRKLMRRLRPDDPEYQDEPLDLNIAAKEEPQIPT